MTYPDPAEVALYGTDGETIVSSEEYDHVSVNDHYVRLQPVVKEPEEVEPGERRCPEKLYVPWRRVHMIRRDYTDDSEEDAPKPGELTSAKR